MADTDRPLPRRPEFDTIVEGWGGDSVQDLHARLQLVAEFQIANGALRPAEQKIANAMTGYLGRLS